MADKRIGFIGVGMMGRGMASCLLRAGREVSVVAHRHRDGVEALLGEGAVEAPDVAQLAERCDAVAMCLSNSRAVEAVMEHLVPHLNEGMVVIDATTADPRSTKEIDERVRERGAAFADAPVTGGPPQAEAGELASLVGCRESDFSRVEAIVGSWSKVVRRFGDPGAGHTAKLLNNFVTQGTATLLAESYDRARRAGVDWQALFDVMQGGAARSGTLDKMVGPALGGDYDGSRFALENARKDIGYYAELAREMDGSASPLAEAVHGVLAGAVEAGHGERFVSALLAPEVVPAWRRAEP